MDQDMENEYGMDPAFLERDALRKAGKPVEIARTERLFIRESILADVPMLYKIWTQSGISDDIKPMQPSLPEEIEFMAAYIHHAYAFYDFGLWTVLEKESGQIVGRAGLFPSEILDNAVELGYLIAPEYQRKGYATECGRAILSYAVEVLDLPEVHLLTGSKNIASIKTAKSLGFEKKEILHADGRGLLHFIFY
jgi:RimJ/RimL family protein N-acetyltransferase